MCMIPFADNSRMILENKIYSNYACLFATQAIKNGAETLCDSFRSLSWVLLSHNTPFFFFFVKCVLCGIISHCPSTAGGMWSRRKESFDVITCIILLISFSKVYLKGKTKERKRCKKEKTSMKKEENLIKNMMQ
jgi:hypothetical protein